MTTRIRNPNPRYTVIPVDFSARQRRAIDVMAARNGVSVEQQIVTLVRSQLGF